LFHPILLILVTTVVSIAPKDREPLALLVKLRPKKRIIQDALLSQGGKERCGIGHRIGNA